MARFRMIVLCPRRLSLFLLTSALLCSSLQTSAQAPGESDAIAVSAVTQPGAVPTGSYYRMRHSLYLLDLCRKVKAGTKERDEVAPLVGGNGVLDALLGMDLDALYQQLSGPRNADPASPSNASLWSLILTRGGGAPPIPSELPESVDFGGVQPRDSPAQSIRVTAAFDGFLQAAVPTDGPFRILAMATYDGTAVRVRRAPESHETERAESPMTTYDETAVRVRRAPGPPVTERAQSLEVISHSRSQAPWSVPVQAGQDVDVVIGLPVGTKIPQGGLTSTLTIGDTTGAVQQDVRLLAQQVLTADYIYVGVDLFHKLWICCTAFVPSFGQVSVPVNLEVANNWNNVDVKGVVKLVSGPPGLTMTNHSFTIKAGGQLTVPLTLYVTAGTQAANTWFVQQPFHLQVSWQSVFFGYAGQTTKNVNLTVYPDSKSWYAVGKGVMECEHSMVLYKFGDLIVDATCENNNIFSGKASVDFWLGAKKGFPYDMGTIARFSKQSTHFTVAWWYPTYTFWITQPMTVTWYQCVGWC